MRLAVLKEHGDDLPEVRVEFVKRLGERRWTPLCRCGYDLRLPEGNVQTWECSYAPVTHPRVWSPMIHDR